MDLGALEFAAAEWIQKRLRLEHGEIGVQPQGRPPASAGNIFVAVHAGAWQSSSDAGYFLDEMIGIQVTVSLKAVAIPLDRWGSVGLHDYSIGLDRIAGLVIRSIHCQYGLLNLANEKIEGEVNKFIEPLRFARGELPTERNAEWWSGSKTNSPGPVGMSRTLSFARARRLQPIEQIQEETL